MQEYSWGGLPFLSPEDLPNPGIQFMFSVSPALAGEFCTTVTPETPWLYSKLFNFTMQRLSSTN